MDRRRTEEQNRKYSISGERTFRPGHEITVVPSFDIRNFTPRLSLFPIHVILRTSATLVTIYLNYPLSTCCYFLNNYGFSKYITTLIENIDDPNKVTSQRVYFWIFFYEAWSARVWSLVTVTVVIYATFLLSCHKYDQIGILFLLKWTGYLIHRQNL